MIKLLQGDCRNLLKTLPEKSVQMCVTSPPYWGLRSYLPADHPLKPFEIGQEKTPREYVQTMVQVFAYVWRALREDGTLWLNLGSSYFGSGQGGNPDSSPHQKQRTNRGSFSYDKRPIRFHGDAPSCDNGDKAPLSSSGLDSACSCLCDGCRDARGIGRSENICPLHGPSLLPSETITRDIEHLDAMSKALGVLPPDAQESTNLLSSALHREDCRHCANCGACLSVLGSSTRDASLCVRKGRYTGGISEHGSAFHSQDKDASGLAYSYLSTPSLNFKQKDMVPIHWMVAMALQNAGWYLRSEITWCKKAPMPESVTDRPTSATEKIFLLTKSADYFYNADAVRNPPSEAMLQQVLEGYNGQASKLFYENGVQDASDVKSRIITNARKRIDKQRGHSRRHAGFNDRWDHLTKAEQMACGSNMRNYWLLGPEPFTDAHFATFPSEIPRRCILAGSKPGDTVLDPFGGSGTTGQVALELGRKAILMDLNPEYEPLQRQRCDTTPGLPL